MRFLQQLEAEAKFSNIIKRLVTFSMDARAVDLLELCDAFDRIINEKTESVNSMRSAQTAERRRR